MDDGSIVSQSVVELKKLNVSACWGLTEGAAGMVSQVKGLAAAVGLPYQLKTVSLKAPWSRLWPGLTPLRESIFVEPQEFVVNEPPRLVLSCGRRAIPAALFLKKQYGDRVFTVHIQDPKVRTSLFDLVIAPEHDGLRGPNVVTTRGAVHHLNLQQLRLAASSPAAEALAPLQRPFVCVLLGGPNRYYGFRSEDLQQLAQGLHRIEREAAVDLAILPSRRTPPEVVKFFADEFAPQHLVWTGAGPNPYLAALALCSHVIVTGDSVSMVSEAAATAKPVFVYHLPERRRARRFRAFHESFERAGVARPFSGVLADWTYPNPNATDQIAQLIRDRLGVSHVALVRPAA